jgi:hypothetical protein
MNSGHTTRLWSTLAALAVVTAGCHHTSKNAHLGDFAPKPNGTISDEVWQQQEANAEASDFVVHEHEWVGNSAHLNAAGAEHVKQIAARAAEVPFPILVERSSDSSLAGTQYEFPVHGDEQLDLQRRSTIVDLLSQMGVGESDQRVLVSPALTPGFYEFQAQRAFGTAYSQGGGMGSGGGVGGGAF